MKVIFAKNVNYALELGLDFLRMNGVAEPSRNGPVLVSPCPVVTRYERPEQRVLFNALRDANPFFHLMESLWMLVGRNDVALPAQYAAQMQLYSDDTVTLNGSAYGHRWRHHFGYDQLAVVIDELKVNPASRRCVVSMWDAWDSRPLDDEHLPGVESYMGDLNFAMAGGKDIPCNTQVYFRIREGLLDMTVCNRSNDVVWGAYGANAVHFSVLHEYMAKSIGCGLGCYYQLSNNFHAYSERPDTQRLLGSQQMVDDRYSAPLQQRVVPTPVRASERFDSELAGFIGAAGPPRLGIPFTEPLLLVAAQMARSHAIYKTGQLEVARDRLRMFMEDVARYDWLVAGEEWLQRRIQARATKGA